MNKFLLALSLIIAAATARGQSAYSPSWYVQPSVVAAFPGGSFKAAAGGDVALGLTLPHEQSVEIDATYFQAEDKDYSFYKVRFTELLAGYKWEFRTASPVSFHVGALAGVTLEQGRYSLYYFSESLNANAFTAGGMVDVAYHFTPMIAVVLGGRVTYLARSSLLSSGTMGLLNLGLNFRF